MPLNKLVKKTEKIEEATEKIEETGEKIESKIDKLMRLLEESIGVLGVYKDIIRTQRKNNIILFILILVLILTLAHNQKEFSIYRENSVDKEVIVEILKNSTCSGD